MILIPLTVCAGWMGACALGNQSQAAPDAPHIEPTRVTTYKETAEGELKLHVFSPAAGTGDTPAPAIVFFFGGGWKSGRTQQFYEQAHFFAERGFVAFSAEYRVKNQHKTSPFQCVEDGKSAVRWIREHAEELGVDPNRIVASGGSAGGHVAACTGVIEGFDAAGEDAGVGSLPNAMILFNPVLDTTESGFEIGPVGRDRRDEISPSEHVRPGLPPTLIFHGTADKTVPFAHAERFTESMREAGNVCRLEAFEGKGHGFFNGSSFRKDSDGVDYERTMQASIGFLGELGFVPVGSVAATTAPNVILIYTDDQGFGDVSAFNSSAKFKTPHLDRLAAEGVAFTNAHSADSVCTPSRYALLTGRYPWRTTMKRGVLGAEAPCLIASGRLTIPSLLKSKGYRTGMVGKWHLGMDFPGTPGDRDWTQPTQDMPLDRGFDYFYGIPASLNYGILAWFEGRHAAVPPTLFTNKKPNERHVDYRIMPPYEESADAVQTALQRPGFEIAPDFVDNQCLTRFTDKAIEWMDGQVAAAKDGDPFFLYLPLTSPHYPVCPLPEFHGRGAAGAYGEFVIETDHHVGRILDFLERSGIDENTLIIFTSDNGPENSWKGRITEFAHDSRGGLRGGKRSVYEGGHRVPMIIRWPAGIQAPGRVFDGLVGQTDVLATVADLVGADLPYTAGEDSLSFATVLKDASATPERVALINHGNGGDFRYSVTEGSWKLVMPNGNHAIELYDLESDRAESENVAADYPEVVKRLTAAITRIVTEGRSNPGPRQPNDTGYWKDLTWMTEAAYGPR